MVKIFISKSSFLFRVGLLSLLSWTSMATPVCQSSGSPSDIPFNSIKILNYTAVKIVEMEAYYGNYLDGTGAYYRGSYDSVNEWQTHNQLAPHPAAIDAEHRYYFYRIDPIGMDDEGPVVKTFRGPILGYSGPVTEVAASTSTSIDLRLNPTGDPQCWEVPPVGAPRISLYLGLALGQTSADCSFNIFANGSVTEGYCSNEIRQKKLFYLATSASINAIGGRQLVLVFGCNLMNSGDDCPLIPLYRSVYWGSVSSGVTGKIIRNQYQSQNQNQH